MTPSSIRRAVTRRPSVRKFVSGGLAAAAVTIAIVAGCSGAEPIAPNALRTAYGPAQSLGNGTARTYVTFNNAGRPRTMGVALTEGALTNLPQTPNHPSPSAAMLMLAPPSEAAATGIDHVMLDWNPAGHEPEHVYTLPHFDFHFYTISTAEQMAIMPSNAQFEERASRLPAADFVPGGYISAHAAIGVSPAAATIPAMGLHWIEGAAPELHGQTFTGTFLYGSYDGGFIFFEPMITKAYIESAKVAPSYTLAAPVKLPAKYSRPGYHPTRYTIQWDPSAKEYRIALDALVQH
jgi:hypothetical protein